MTKNERKNKVSMDRDEDGRPMLVCDWYRGDAMIFWREDPKDDHGVMAPQYFCGLRCDLGPVYQLGWAESPEEALQDGLDNLRAMVDCIETLSKRKDFTRRLRRVIKTEPIDLEHVINGDLAGD